MGLSVEEMRSELANMDRTGATLADMENFMSNESMRSDDASAVYSRYLSVHNPGEWLENFIDEAD